MKTDWQVGDRIQNRWEIHYILEGGMGKIYVVYDHEFHEAFAAKTFSEELFSRSPRSVERFNREALSWVNLELHQNVTHARFLHLIDERPFLFLEYVSGGDLSLRIGKPELVDNFTEVLRLAIQFCDGMIHANSRGIEVHRDIKPQNCLVTVDGTLKITDFGLAKVIDHDEDIGESHLTIKEVGSRRVRQPKDAKSGAITGTRGRASGGLTETGVGLGTLAYMAPEQFQNARHVDPRADVYSFGVMLFQMTTVLAKFELTLRKYLKSTQVCLCQIHWQVLR